MITRIEISFENEDEIVLTWFQDVHWERLDFLREIPGAEARAKLKAIELLTQAGGNF